MVQLGLMVGVVRTGNRGCSPQLYADSQADIHLHGASFLEDTAHACFQGHTDVGLETEPPSPWLATAKCRRCCGAWEAGGMCDETRQIGMPTIPQQPVSREDPDLLTFLPLHPQGIPEAGEMGVITVLSFTPVFYKCSLHLPK